MRSLPYSLELKEVPALIVNIAVLESGITMTGRSLAIVSSTLNWYSALIQTSFHRYKL